MCVKSHAIPKSPGCKWTFFGGGGLPKIKSINSKESVTFCIWTHFYRYASVTGFYFSDDHGDFSDITIILTVRGSDTCFQSPRTCSSFPLCSGSAWLAKDRRGGAVSVHQRRVSAEAEQWPVNVGPDILPFSGKCESLCRHVG